MPRFCLPPFIGFLLLLLPLGAHAQTASTVQEDRVDLTWPSDWQADRTQSVYVYRNAISGPPDGTLGNLLTVASAQPGTWSDQSGVPMQRYEYCLVRRAPDQTEQARACLEGRRVIRPVRSLTATAGLAGRADGIALAWRNTSGLEGRTISIYRSDGSNGETQAVISPQTLIASGLPAATTSYLDEGAPPALFSVYAVTTVSEGVGSDPAHVRGYRSTVPAAASVIATDGSDPDSVRVSWKASETYPVVRYQVWREPLDSPGDADGQIIYENAVEFNFPVTEAQQVQGTSFSFADGSAAPGVYYEYCVLTYGADSFSFFSCDVGSRTGLQPPTAVAATDNAFDNRVDVTWTYDGSDANGFVVSRACVLGREGAACAAGTETAVDIGSVGASARRYEDRTAVQGVTYRYDVAATTTRGARSAVGPDQQDQGTRAYVLAPTMVAATDGSFEDRVVVSWETTSTTALVFTVTRGGIVIGVVSPTTRSLIDQNIGSDVTSSYCVSTLTVPAGASQAVANRMRADIQAALARSGDATLATSNQATRDRLAADVARIAQRVQSSLPVAGSVAGADPVTSAPTCDNGFRSLRAPQSVAATDDEDERVVRVTWQDVSGVETGYVVYRWTGSTAVAAGRVGPNRTQFVDAGGTAGVGYTYSVATVDALGEPQADGLGGTFGGRSAISTDGTTPLASVSDAGRRILLPPSSVTATDGQFENQVIIRWADNSAIVENAGYRVERWPTSATQPGGAAPTSGIATVCDVGPRATECVDTSFTSADYGVGYTYRVHAYQNDGRSLPVASGGDRALGGTVILPPADLSASTTYDGQVIVTWTDASAVNSGYRLKVDSMAVTDASLASATASTYTDAGLTSTATRTYCVSAYSGSESRFSEEVCASGNARRTDQTVAASFGTRLSAPFTSGSSANGFLGQSVAVSGGRALVSAPYEESDAGVVYHFTRDANGWSNGGVLPKGGVDFRFGWSLDMSDDHAIVGTLPEPNRTASETVYMYRRSGAGWELTQQLTTADGARRFGEYVALAGDYAFVSSRLPDGVNSRLYVFVRVGNAWQLNQTHQIDDEVQALSAGADWVAVTVRQRDAFQSHVRLLRRSGAQWTFTPDRLRNQTTFNGQQFFNVVRSGRAVDVQGDRIAVTAEWNEMQVWRFDRTSEVWQVEQRIPNARSSATFGEGVALSEEDGEVYLAIGDLVGNRVQTHFIEDGEWKPLGDLRATAGQEVDGLGRSVALGGNDLVIGAHPNAFGTSTLGAAYFGTLVLQPGAVSASDGTYDNRIQVRWRDRTDVETGYRVYRSDSADPVGTVEAGVTVFDDFDAPPGGSFSYCVAGYVAASDGSTEESPRGCDIGWRPADGRISGRVASQEGAGVAGVDVCLMPGPNRGLLLDGVAGGARAAALGSLGNAFTIELWTRRSRTGQSETLLSHGRAAQREGLRVGFAADGSATFDFFDTPLVASAPSDPLTWTHYAFSFDGTTRTIYRNGVSVAQDTPGAAYTGSGEARLGVQPDGSGRFSGLLDEVRVWTGARTAAQIAGASQRRLTGDEGGLVAYWPLDQGSGIVAPDVTERAAHLSLEGGAHWGGGAPGVGACQTTTADGSYTHSGLRYGEGLTFAVRPSAPGRAFRPGEQAINLTPESPVENQVDFTDTSVFSVAGTITLGSGAGACAADSVSLFVDGVFATTTKADGSYALSVDPTLASDPDNRFRRITARRTQGQSEVNLFAFAPGLHEFAAQSDTTGIDFAVTTQRTLTGFVGGGCNTSLGTVTLRVYTEDGCFDQTIQVQDAIAQQLAPQSYLVDVVDVQLPSGSPLNRSDVLDFYDGLGTQRIDLTAADARLDLIYRAPVEVLISGLPTPDAQCAATGLIADGTQIPNVPVIAEYATLPLNITVQERYGPGDVCPLDSVEVQIFDGFADRQNDPVTVTTRSSGDANYDTFGRSPEITSGALVGGVDRSYQKSLSAVATIPGRGTVTNTVWAVVEGYRERESEFISATTADMPLMVLHDPPGSESYAYLEEGTTSCTRISNFTVQNFGAGQILDVALGFKAALGFGITIENGAGLLLQTKVIAGQESRQLAGGADSNLEICATTTERFTTAGDRTWVGEDIMVGTALNLKFALADDLSVNGCAIDFSEKLATDLDQAQPFATTYVYGKTHIEHSLIPALENLVALNDATIEGDEDGDETLEQIKLSDALANWGRFLTQNEDNIASAFAGTRASENRSFSGGTEYEWSHVADTTRTLRQDVTQVYVNSENAIGVVVTGFGYDSKFAAGFNLSQQWTTESGETGQNTKTVGYVLADGDTGDSFTVDVGTDPAYGTPAFRTVSGRSSWPWEPGTQRRDWVTATIPEPVQRGVDADGTAVFTLNLANRSESKETREYVLAVSKENNPHSAVIGITGDPIDNEVFVLQPDQTISVTLGVERGPGDIYDYEDLVVLAYPAVEYDIWRSDPRQTSAMIDTARFSVSFTPLCSPITLQRPETGWRVNADQVGTTVELSAREFAIAQTTDDRIGFEYRRDGGPWTLASATTGSTLAGATDVSYAWTPPGEGSYDVRAFAQCKLDSGEQARTDTPSVEGRVDTTRPQVLGPPQPADGALDLGDDVTLRLTEAIDCTSALTTPINGYRALGIRDSGGNAIAVDAVCEGRQVSLVPRSETYWSSKEGQTFTAFVSAPARSTVPADNNRVLAGLTDVAGNPLAGSDDSEVTSEIAWTFTVRRSLIRFDPPNVAATLGRGEKTTATASLANDDATPRTIKLTAVPSWLSLRPSAGLTLAADTTATLVPGARLPITFDVADTLAIGPHTAEVWTYGMNASVVDSSQAARLRFDVLVGCSPPGWSVDPGTFAYSMQMLAGVQVPRSGDPTATGLDRTTDYRGLETGTLAAFVGSELRGVAEMTAIGSDQRVALTIYGNRERGEAIRFEVYDPATCVRYTAAGPGASFESGKQVGSPSTPTTIYAVPPSQSDGLTFAAGWTWFSLPFVPADPAVGVVLRSVPASEGDRIQATDANAQQVFAQYDAGSNAWIGSLQSLAPGKGYRLYLSQQAFLPTPTSPTLPDPSQSLPLIPGWNWIGYLPGCPTPVAQALSGLTVAPTTGDLLKSQRGFAIFDESAGGWYGSLTEMAPGEGYQLRVAGGGSLAYPTDRQPDGLGVCAGSSAPPSVDPSLWQAGPQAFGSQMTLVVAVPGLADADSTQAAYEVVALADDGSDQPAVRGVAKLTYDAGLGRHLAYLSVGGLGTTGEEIRLLLGEIGSRDALHITTEGAMQQTSKTAESLGFVADDVRGTPSTPLVFDGLTLTQPTSTSLARSGIPLTFALEGNAPNPAFDRTTIRFALPTSADVEMEVFDLLGRRVAVLIDQRREAGYHDEPFDTRALASGVYVVRIRATAGSETHKAVHRVVVAR